MVDLQNKFQPDYAVSPCSGNLDKITNRIGIAFCLRGLFFL